jgi:hypothetical protein
MRSVDGIQGGGGQIGGQEARLDSDRHRPPHRSVLTRQLFEDRDDLVQGQLWSAKPLGQPQMKEPSFP